MSRVPVPNGATPLSQVSPIADTNGKVHLVIIQNVSPIDIWVSEDANRLQQTDVTNLPTVGLHFHPDNATLNPFILVLPFFNGKLYARSQNPGGILEVLILEVCPSACAQTGITSDGNYDVSPDGVLYVDSDGASAAA